MEPVILTIDGKHPDFTHTRLFIKQLPWLLKLKAYETDTCYP